MCADGPVEGGGDVRRMQGNKCHEYTPYVRHCVMIITITSIFEHIIKYKALYIMISFNSYNNPTRMISLFSQFFRKESQ